MPTYIHTAVATAVHTLLHACISSFHPIAKPCSPNPQILFSEMVLDPLTIKFQ